MNAMIKPHNGRVYTYDILRPKSERAERPPLSLRLADPEWHRAGLRLGSRDAEVAFADGLPAEPPGRAPALGWPVQAWGELWILISDHQDARSKLVTLCHEAYHVARNELIVMTERDGQPKFVRAAWLKGHRIDESAAEAWAQQQVGIAERRADSSLLTMGLAAVFWRDVLRVLGGR